MSGTPFEAGFDHRGYEQIVAGRNVNPAFGTLTPTSYSATDVALSADGRRLWTVFYHEFSSPQYLLWSMDSHAGSALQSATDNSITAGGVLYARTDASGSLAVLDSSTQFWRVTAPGQPLQLMFALDGANFSLAEGRLRVSADGGLAVFLDRWNRRMIKVDLSAGSPAPVVIASAPLFAYLGRDPRSTFGFDMSNNGGEWYLAAENFYSEVGRNRYWVNHGSGLVGPSNAIENIGDDAQPVSNSYNVETTADGSLFGYCVASQTPLSARCYLQAAGDGERLAITDGNRAVGGLVLADDGSRIYVQSDAGSGGAYGYFQSADGSRRWLGGSQRLAGHPSATFFRARLSHDGRVLASPTPLGAYVLHDGADAPAAFPRIQRIQHYYDAASDHWVVRALVDAPDGIERLYTLPLFRGLEPTRQLVDGQNPWFNERGGGGVNFSTTFTADPDAPGWWERRINLSGKRSFLTREFQLRLVLVDHTGHRTSFYDFTPMAAHPEQQVEALSAAANASSRRPMSDAAGRYVVFESDADNLLADGGGPGIFRRDNRDGSIERISIDDADVPIPGAAREASISADGERIVFVAPLAAPTALRGESKAARMQRQGKGNGWGIFLRSMLTGNRATTLIGSANSTGVDTLPRIAPGGDVVVFASDTPPGGATGALAQIYHVPLGSDLLPQAGQTQCLSCKTLDVGSGAPLNADSNGSSRHPVLSADGQTVAWESAASNATNAPGACVNASARVVMRNLLTGTVQQPGNPPDPDNCNAGGSGSPQLDFAGRHLVYSSEQPVKPGDSNGLADVYLFDSGSGIESRVSEGPGGAQADAPAQQPVLSGDGRVISFASAASTLDGNAPAQPGQTELFVRESSRSGLLRLDKTSNGAGADGASTAPALSYSGGDLVFESAASNLVGGNPQVALNVFRPTNPLSAGRVFADGFD